MDYKKITIKELCEHARINKKTFYRYYDVLDDLLAGTQNDLTRLIENFFYTLPKKDPFIKSSPVSFYCIIRKTVQPISELHRIGIKPKHPYVVLALVITSFYCFFTIYDTYDIKM